MYHVQAHLEPLIDCYVWAATASCEELPSRCAAWTSWAAAPAGPPSVHSLWTCTDDGRKFTYVLPLKDKNSS